MSGSIKVWVCAAFFLVVPCGCHEEKSNVAFQPPKKEREPTIRLTNVQFSPDGKMILAAFSQAYGKGKYGFCREFTSLYDSTTGKRLADGPPHYIWPPHCPFVPDSTLLLIQKPGIERKDEKPVDRWPLALWDWQTKKVIREFVPSTEHVGSVAVSPNGKLALTGHWDGQILAWDVATGKQIRSFDTARESDLSTGHIPRLFFTRDCSRVVSCSGDNIKVWDTLTGKEAGPKFTEYVAAQQASYHDYSVLSPDGLLLCTALTHHHPANPMIRIWDLNSGNLKTQFNFRREAGTLLGAVAFADHGKRLLFADRQGLRFWHVATGKPLSAVKVPGEWESISPDGRFVVTTPERRNRFMGHC